jgi:hypothetical protein
MSCERSLKSERATNESEKSSATHIATTTTMLTMTCSIKYRAIVVVSLTYLIRTTMKNLFILLHKMLEMIKSFLLT